MSVSTSPMDWEAWVLFFLQLAGVSQLEHSTSLQKSSRFTHASFCETSSVETFACARMGRLKVSFSRPVQDGHFTGCELVHRCSCWLPFQAQTILGAPVPL
jgi:hypothetical protein